MKANIIAIVLILMIPAFCFAAPARPGAYLSGFIGATMPKDTTATTDDFSGFPPFSDRVEFDPGINVGITTGYDFGYLRLEGELSYKQGEINEITERADNYRFGNVDGDLGVFAMMFNGFFDLHNDSPITPYFGGGIGFATLYISDTYGTDTRGVTTTRPLLYEDDADTVFAYQVGGGLEIAINPMLSVDLSYRYFGTSEARFEGFNQSTELEFESHNVAVGFRMKF
ncbi:MAG TPA: outer membrane beta-barrel protein [Geobacteraceae bacterium]|nr:outer membrane beta-barrel protein [Geobacteraceae bacterium]